MAKSCLGTNKSKRAANIVYLWSQKRLVDQWEYFRAVLGCPHRSRTPSSWSNRLSAWPTEPRSTSRALSFLWDIHLRREVVPTRLTFDLTFSKDPQNRLQNYCRHHWGSNPNVWACWKSVRGGKNFCQHFLPPHLTVTSYLSSILLFSVLVYYEIILFSLLLLSSYKFSVCVLVDFSV